MQKIEFKNICNDANITDNDLKFIFHYLKNYIRYNDDEQISKLKHYIYNNNIKTFKLPNEFTNLLYNNKFNKNLAQHILNNIEFNDKKSDSIINDIDEKYQLFLRKLIYSLCDDIIISENKNETFSKTIELTIFINGEILVINLPNVNDYNINNQKQHSEFCFYYLLDAFTPEFEYYINPKVFINMLEDENLINIYIKQMNEMIKVYKNSRKQLFNQKELIYFGNLWHMHLFYNKQDILCGYYKADKINGSVDWCDIFEIYNYNNLELYQYVPLPTISGDGSSRSTRDERIYRKFDIEYLFFMERKDIRFSLLDDINGTTYDNILFQLQKAGFNYNQKSFLENINEIFPRYINHKKIFAFKFSHQNKQLGLKFLKILKNKNKPIVSFENKNHLFIFIKIPYSTNDLDKLKTLFIS